MKATMEKIDNSEVVFEIEVPQAEVAKAVDKAYHKLASKVNIPGFRKGKTNFKFYPILKIFKNHYSTNSISILAAFVKVGSGF